jgi:hypothetical protein
MSLPADRLLNDVPRRLPIGAKYVIEGFGEEGNLRVVSRYLVLPDGHRINVPSDLFRLPSPRAQAVRRSSRPARSQGKGRSGNAAKKIGARRGTG